jgi:acyl-CoA synthetase (AMP-forming)/AMP-acid ligase II
VNLGMLLEMVADAAGDRLIVGSRRDGLTAQELKAAARRVATLLSSPGVEYVGMVDLNSEAVPVALFGASLAGLPFAPINYRLTDDRLNAIVARLAPGIVRSV